MDTKAQKILSIIESQGPIKASEIAKITGLEKKEVNQYLYFRLKPFCMHNEKYEWEIKPSIDIADVKEPTQQQRINSHQPQLEPANSYAVHCDSQVIEQDNQKKENNVTMPEYKKIDRWADKLLDTGKRNNLMNFRDSKASTAEVVFPDCEKVFSKCSLGHVFEVYDPKIQVDDIEEENEIQLKIVEAEEKLNKDDFRKRYSSRLKGDKYLLVYAQTPNPMTAVKNIAKKAKTMQDETGVNVAYLAFGFLKWNEKEGSEVFFRAPLLLVHINLITGSVVDPVKIEIADDDVLVNPTFNYFLQADFGLTLPEYEDGETLSQYYSKVSDMVRKLGWEVLNECKIGNFSFLKINMYEDLKKNSELILKNKNIQVLLGDTSPDLVGVGGEEHVVKNPLIDLHTVVEADSSQIKAIEMAKSGKSFVLQGPPGTGKSQTITNIIAECLHDGKKVLFVSEKQAALNVVFDKLKKAGLEDFCLELHSHKANKKAVIEELNRTLEVPKSRVSSSANDEIHRKELAQYKLDHYAAALHKKREGINKSLYQLFELYSAERNYPELNYSIRNIYSKDQEDLQLAVRLLEEYAEYVPSIGQDYRKNAWYGFNSSDISFDEQRELKEDLALLVKEFRRARDITSSIQSDYDLPDFNFDDADSWMLVLDFLGNTDVVMPALLTEDGYNELLPYLEDMRDRSEVIIPIREQIERDFNLEVIDEIDGNEISEKLNGQFSSFFSRLFNEEYKGLISTIQPFVKSGVKLKYQQAKELAEKLVKIQAEFDAFYESETETLGCLGDVYDGVDTDWDRVMTDLEELASFYDDGFEYFGSISDMENDEFDESQRLFDHYADVLDESLDSLVKAKEKVSKYFSSEIFDFDTRPFDECLEKLKKCYSEYGKLTNWNRFLGLIPKLQMFELSPVVSEAIERNLKPEDIVGAYRRAFYKQWIEYIIYYVPELSGFNRIQQDHAVKVFVEKDSLQYEISKYQIKSELSEQRPNLEMVAGGSAVSILQREGQKKRKQLPIRRLLAETGSLVQIIKPCFLMSPLSVSTFLEAGKIEFDTVVFDEASQIFPQDAIGAIYRGKQIIVVGDSRQMPPSNFFTATTDIDDEDDEVGDITDFESILDICSAVFNTERLSWHYRSHYEQLIAFSNLNFYNNSLVTFPSASTDHKGIGVDYYYVDGVFDRKSKTNRAEAEFIVDLVYKNIEEFPERSLGVVAFSASQQDLIDRLISKRREADQSFEWFFKSDSKEPFFVKNLETVQGDERDTIIFSVAYAKDSQGRFIQNFGPLNREGGERRLNVAITRAKENVQLVASIHHTDINICSTGSRGVHLLRAYLDYAQNGEQALERTISVSGDDHFDSYFEQEVCDYLRDHGFVVDTQIGCSGYKIDLGIRLPDSSKYVLAVECDGATYHSSKNARDRDSLRQRVLENMGWSFYRIWSTDWYRNTAVEKERLLNAARDAVEKGKAGRPQPKNLSNEAKVDEESISERFQKEIKEDSSLFPEYYELDALHLVKSFKYFFPKGIREILQVEAPLSEEYLLKRIAPYFGREKVTKVVIEEFNRLMRDSRQVGIVRKNGFLYLTGNNDIQLRIPGVKREIKYISIEELAAGLYTLMKQNVDVSKDGIYKTLTNLLGFSRTGDAIVERYDEALLALKKQGKIEEHDGVISLL